MMADHGGQVKADHGGQAAVSCQMCEQSSQIKKKCLDCDYLLCANCCQLHKKIKDLSNHQLVDLHDIGTTEERVHLNFKNIECRSHAEQKCCLFCEDCDKVVCAICISEKHNQHKMIPINEGYKLHTNKIATWRTEIKKKMKTLTTDLSTLNTNYSTENTKYEAEKEKILGRDKVLKVAVDTQTKTLVTDLDQRWSKIDQSVKEEMIQNDKYKLCLQSREEQLKKALESSNAEDIFRAVEKEQRQKRSDSDRTVNFKYETLPTFKSKEINLSVLTSQHGSLLENNSKTEVKNITIHAIECYKTDSEDISYIQCNSDGTLWIYHHMDDLLRCVEKKDNGSLTTTKKIHRNFQNIAVTLNGDLLLSVGGSHLLVIPHKQQTIKKSHCSVSPLVTTAAIHAYGNKVIVGAREIGPLYPVSGPRQIIVMDRQGKQEKVYQFDGNNRPLFTNPSRVTMDSKNSVYVLDRKDDTYRGRVVIMNNQTGKIIVYNGNPNINNQDHPLKPGDLVATKSDNIIISDRENHTLHVLNSDGECVKFINTEEHGIKWPWCLDIDNRDLLHIGCFKTLTIKAFIGLSTAKLHVVKFTGF